MSMACDRGDGDGLFELEIGNNRRYAAGAVLSRRRRRRRYLVRFPSFRFVSLFIVVSISLGSLLFFPYRQLLHH